MKHISILGSTGSIGTQTVDIVLEQKDIKVHGITAGRNIDLLEEQIGLLHPEVVAVMDLKKAEELKERVAKTYPETKIVSGISGIIEVATLESVQMVITAVVGMIGLRPTVAAIKAGKDIGLANKETLVTAGELIMKLAKEHQVSIIPVDSEHSAIFQSMVGESKVGLEKILLTASGGPFRGYSKEDLKEVTLEDALKHPNWTMGHKITIDSSTLMNKGLEVIEAKWLFDVEPNDIQVVVHPQSIIHSMVQYKDSSVIGQMGLPDMKLPIQYAIYYPQRRENSFKRLDLFEVGTLTFEAPDVEVFPCLSLAYKALEIGGTMPTVLNATNEKAVALFLEKKIRYVDIPIIIEKVMDSHDVKPLLNIDVVLEAEKWSHEKVIEILDRSL